MPACEPHPTTITGQIYFAKIVVAEDCMEFVTEAPAQFFQTFTRTLASRVIAHSHERGVTRVIAHGDDEIGRADFIQESVEQMVLMQRAVQPDMTTIELERPAEQRIADAGIFVFIATCLFSCA